MVNFSVWAATIFVGLAMLIMACQPLQPETNNGTKPLPQPQENGTAECTADSDCGTGGCSGQVCTTAEKAPDIITTCEYRPEYGCLKLTSCGCAEGKCTWRETAAYNECLQNTDSAQAERPQ